MSGHGSPTLDVDGTGLKVVVVAGSWHDEISDGLIAGATRTLEASGASYELVRVPGSFELPVVAKAALEAGADAVVALGVIIRGGTPHFEYICTETARGLMQVSLSTGLPVLFGVLTTDTVQDALDRAGGSEGNKGAEAALAAIEMAAFSLERP